MAVTIPHTRRSHLALVASSILLLIFVWARLIPSTPRAPPHFDPSYGLLSPTDASSPVAIATFLSGTLAPAHDPYFVSARILTYQLLHDPRTRVTGPDGTTPPIPFLVLCTRDVSAYKKAQLAADGATVVEVDDVPLPGWISTGVARWRDQFTKLRLLQMTQYARVLFLDADSLLTSGDLPQIFSSPAATTPARTLLSPDTANLTAALTSGALKADEAPLPAEYVFAARPDNALAGARNHTFPPQSHDAFSAGFWLAAPSTELYTYLLSIMAARGRFPPHEMEQAMLNYAFRRAGGAMPWAELDARWSATWPNDADVAAGVVSLHEKNWIEGPEEIRARWWALKAEVEERLRTVVVGEEEGLAAEG